MPYTDQNAPHAGSAEVLVTGMFDEPAGSIARTVPRPLIVSGTLGVIVSGTVYVRLVPLPQGMLVSNLAVHMGTTAEAGGTHGWLALLDAGLNVLAVTADQTGAAVFAASTFIKLPVTIPYLVPQTGVYYVAVCITATTMPTIATGNATTNGLSQVLPAIWGTAGAGAAPPAAGSQLNGGAVTTGGFNFGGWLS